MYKAYLAQLDKQWGQYASLPDLPKHVTSAETARLLDLMAYLPGDLLHKVDRASMFNALEVRCPMLDRDLVSKVLPLSHGELCEENVLKGLLKKIAKRYLPKAILQRKKMGFALPIGQWFRQSHQPMLQRWLIDEPHLVEIGFEIDALREMIREHVANREDHTHRLFTLLTLAIHQSNSR